MIKSYAAKVEDAWALSNKAGGDEDRDGGLQTRNRGPLARNRPAGDSGSSMSASAANQDLGRLAQAADRWQAEWRQRFDKETSALAPAGELAAANGLREVRCHCRASQRLQVAPHGAAKGKLLDKLAEKHDVQIARCSPAPPRADLAIQATATPHSRPRFPIQKARSPISRRGLKRQRRRARRKRPRRGRALQRWPAQRRRIAARSGARARRPAVARLHRRIRQSSTQPRDLAVVTVDAPESVFFQDPVRGQITLKDDMPAGLPFTVTVRMATRCSGSRTLLTEGKDLRKVPFDFADQRGGEGAAEDAARMRSRPPAFRWSCRSAFPSGRRPRADQQRRGFRLRAVTQKRRILLLDGRSRWETRYLRNMFERDEQWEINTVIAGATSGQTGFAARQCSPINSPATPLLLDAYDLIVFGEVPRGAYSRGTSCNGSPNFVAKRGGAIVFIDGPRGCLEEYAATPLGPLFPVEWKAPEVARTHRPSLRPGRRAMLGALSLVAREGAEHRNLAQPAAAALALRRDRPARQRSPGGSGSARAPGDNCPPWFGAPSAPGRCSIMPLRTRGAGATKWPILYHVKYWNQIANWIAELPFAVRDKFVSLDAGAITYRPGESANIRVRVHDGEGQAGDRYRRRCRALSRWRKPRRHPAVAG